MKERVTLTLDKNLLKQVDAQVDGFKIKNRSHSVEILISAALGGDRPKKALILAGGKGTRLAPITQEIPKPLIPLQGKPLLEHTFDLLKKFGITDVIISIGYKKEKIKEQVGNGKAFGINVTYVEEDEALGTAGPVKLAAPYLTEPFIVANADELKNIDIKDMFRFHKANNSTATLALTTVEDPSKYGAVVLRGNQITEFVEKPKGESPSNLINAGFYILEPEILKYIPSGHAMFETDVFPKLAKEGKLFGYSFGGQWFDTGTLERYEKAIKEWKGLK
ncbi:MAG: sugar phosphate nucleotidyltransferase [Nanoarchaeota archaeon]